MIRIASIGFVLAAITIAFFNLILAWLFLALPLAWIFLTWLVLRSRKQTSFPNLSPAANKLMQKFGHYYAHPFAGTLYSSAASCVTLAIIVVALIGVFKSFWWGVLIGVVLYPLSAWLARQFNPQNFLIDDIERNAHNEVVTMIQNRLGKGAA